MRLAALALLGACGSSAPLADAVVPRELELDVVMTSTALFLRTHGSDRSYPCNDPNWSFPTPGECIVLTDGLSCDLESCLEATLIGTGFHLEAETELPVGLSLPSPVPDDLTLQLGGCGHSRFEIPLAPYTAPTPTLQAEVVADMLVASWQTDVPAASAWVSFMFGSLAHDCHLPGTAHMHAVPAGEITSLTRVMVATFVPVVDIASPLGVVRLWRGNSAHQFVQQPGP